MAGGAAAAHRAAHRHHHTTNEGNHHQRSRHGGLAASSKGAESPGASSRGSSHGSPRRVSRRPSLRRYESPLVQLLVDGTLSWKTKKKKKKTKKKKKKKTTTNAFEKSKRWVQRWYESPKVQFSVALIIAANFASVIVEKQIWPSGRRDAKEGPRYSSAFGALELVFNVLFTAELGANFYGQVRWVEFWWSGWNVFDLVTVGISWLVYSLEEGSLPSSLRLLRTVRAVRVFRLFKRIESMRHIMEALGSAVPGVLNALLIMVISMSIYAILAVDFFRTKGAGGALDFEWCAGQGIAADRRDEVVFDPATGLWGLAPLEGCPARYTARGNDFGHEYFGNFFKSLFTMFQVLMGDSWSAIARPLLHNWGGAATGLFFVSFVLLHSVVLVNVVVAVLLEKMVDDGTGSDRDDEERTAEKNGGRALEEDGASSGDDDDHPDSGGGGSGGGDGGNDVPPPGDTVQDRPPPSVKRPRALFLGGEISESDNGSFISEDEDEEDDESHSFDGGSQFIRNKVLAGGVDDAEQPLPITPPPSTLGRSWGKSLTSPRGGLASSFGVSGGSFHHPSTTTMAKALKKTIAKGKRKDMDKGELTKLEAKAAQHNAKLAVELAALRTQVATLLNGQKELIASQATDEHQLAGVSLAVLGHVPTFKKAPAYSPALRKKRHTDAAVAATLATPLSKENASPRAADATKPPFFSSASRRKNQPHAAAATGAPKPKNRPRGLDATM